MKPLVKYRGGKGKEIPHFTRYMPGNFDRYIEPFLGGGALYFYLEPNRAIINDINKGLMDFYRGIRDNFEETKHQLSNLQSIYDKNQSEYQIVKDKHPDDRVENKNEALYYKIRDMYNGNTEKQFNDAVLYFFINKTAYSGMIRYNKNGEYNVPYGRYKNFNTSNVTTAHHQLLIQADIYSVDYKEIFDISGVNDFIFLDPPYDCVFSDYGNPEMADGFGEDRHIKLANDFYNLNTPALLVVGKTPLTFELYRNNIVTEYEKSYAVNIRNRFKSESKHIIVTNY